MKEYPFIGKLCSWPLVVGFLFGAGFIAFVVYPPAPNWGSNEKWGDVATWLSSFASSAAVVVALWIALRDGRRRDAEAAAARLEQALRVKLYAGVVCPEVGELLVRCLVWQLMAKDDRFGLEEIYQHVVSARCTALETAVGRIFEFEVSDGFDIAASLNSYHGTRMAMTGNLAWMSNWSTQKRQEARRELLQDLVTLQRILTVAHSTVLRISGLAAPPGTPMDHARVFMRTQRAMFDAEHRDLAIAMSICR